MEATWRIVTLAVLALVVVLAGTSSAFAQTGYDMSLTLPTYGKSGCMVCHGDPNLVRIKAGKLVSFALDQTKIDASAHARVACTACHTDFASSLPHRAAADWRSSAKTACKACHPREWDALANSVHGPGRVPGQKYTGGVKPSCGDCHGGHYISATQKNTAATAALHASAGKMCGDCHKDYWQNYNDYYHGAAYNKGAQDAPACWDCHGAHNVLPSANADSSTNTDNLATTCSKCHQGTTDAYTQYATIIHKKDRLLASNPVYAVIRQTGATISDALAGFMQQLRAVFATQQAKAATP